MPPLGRFEKEGQFLLQRVAEKLSFWKNGTIGYLFDHFSAVDRAGGSPTDAVALEPILTTWAD